MPKFSLNVKIVYLCPEEQVEKEVFETITSDYSEDDIIETAFDMGYSRADKGPYSVYSETSGISNKGNPYHVWSELSDPFNKRKRR